MGKGFEAPRPVPGALSPVGVQALQSLFPVMPVGAMDPKLIPGSQVSLSASVSSAAVSLAALP